MAIWKERFILILPRMELELVQRTMFEDKGPEFR